jgi:transposase
MTRDCMIGLDIGKTWLDTVAGSSGTPQRFANDTDGHQHLIAWAQDHQPRLVILEASGGYERGIATALDAAGIAVVVRNPTQIRRFAQSLGQRAKTDQIDARLLARYGEQTAPDPTPLPSPELRTVAALLARRGQLVRMRTQEKNRLKQADPVVTPYLQDHLETLTKQLTKLEADLKARIRQVPEAWARVCRLMTAPGIGALTAIRLVVELPELGQRTAQQMAALVGVAPFDRQSGQHRGRATIGGGRAAVRHGLYLPTLAAIRTNPTFTAHYAQLRARGKAPKVAVIACLHKLLGLLNVMLHDELNWSETQVGQGAFLRREA